jgi:hypothetical protein
MLDVVERRGSLEVRIRIAAFGFESMSNIGKTENETALDSYHFLRQYKNKKL